MVTTSQLSASTANIEQALIGLPSTNKVQAPQTCTSHPSFAPVRPNCSRTRSSSVSRGSTSAVLSTPLTVREIAFFMRCSVQSKIQNQKFLVPHRALIRFHGSPLHQHPDNCTFVLCGSTQIGYRITFLGCCFPGFNSGIQQ